MKAEDQVVVAVVVVVAAAAVAHFDIEHSFGGPDFRAPAEATICMVQLAALFVGRQSGLWAVNKFAPVVFGSPLGSQVSSQPDQSFGGVADG